MELCFRLKISASERYPLVCEPAVVGNSVAPPQTRELGVVNKEVRLRAPRTLAVGSPVSEGHDRQHCKVELALELLRYRGSKA